VPRGAIDLSVVVVFFNMRREAARTLQSLTRTYQHGIDDLSYEVIVVDNGSKEDQRLGEAFVHEFGPEFRYIEIGTNAPASPTVALNRGIRALRERSRRRRHVLTRASFNTEYRAAELRTGDRRDQQWYVGPGQQPEAVIAGYNANDEDGLFRHIEWPRDGYRLFEIGTSSESVIGSTASSRATASSSRDHRWNRSADL
jgi:glycosyltransferase involved in cell wall biosynthesis